MTGTAVPRTVSIHKKINMFCERVTSLTYYAAVNTATFEVYESKDGFYRFHLKGTNGEVVASSEGYSMRENANRGVDTVKRIVPTATVKDIN